MNKINFSKYQNIYITPYTDLTINLRNYIENKFNISIKGFIDISKNEKGIYKPEQIPTLKIDKILILSPNHKMSIFKNLLSFISQDKLLLIDLYKNSYIKRNNTAIQIKLCIDKIISNSFFKLFTLCNIKISFLWTNSIGEFSLENEKFLRKLQIGELDNKTNYFLLTENVNNIANKTIYTLYKDFYKNNYNIFLIENKFLIKTLKKALQFKNIKDTFQLQLSQYSNEYELFIKTKPSLKFSKNDLKKGHSLLKKLKINDPYVCIYARDSKYLSTHASHDCSYHDYRNADINTFNLMIEYLINKGFCVVRVGNIVNQKSTIINDKFIDYPYSKYVSDFMDIFLISKCEFMVGTTSGLMDISGIFGKPRIGVNQIPIDHAPYSTNKDIYLPKKLKYKDQYLSLFKYFELLKNTNLSYWKKETYTEIGITIENNSEEEILHIVKEHMKEYMYDEIDSINQSKYLNIHSNSEDFGKVKTRISSYFLKNNKWYLE